ncbi:MAG: YitT family protein [Candidatus Caenarcaniphilales bacterium]|nr:YitT family protein [Candidatus Caenarcaniphilales bacterium]
MSKSAENISFSPILRVVLMVLGITSAAFGLKGFLLPNHFIDGGITGVSMLTAKSTRIPLAFLLLPLNLPFLIFGISHFNLRFALKSLIGISLLAICIFYVDFPEVTHDRVLAAIFGGAFLGGGIGLAIRGGSVLDGTEILALLLSKNTIWSVGEVILIFNAGLFLLSSFVLGLEAALLSALAYFTASRTIDFILHGLEEYNAVNIISEKSNLIRSAIIDQLGRSVTIYQGKGGYSGTSMDILLCVVTRLELQKLKDLIQTYDENAFILTHTLTEAQGSNLGRLSG